SATSTSSLFRLFVNGYENSKTLIRIVRITKKQVKSKIFDRDSCGCLGKIIELLSSKAKPVVPVELQVFLKLQSYIRQPHFQPNFLTKTTSVAIRQ
ncbi:MAG: hypothetical protein LBL39_07600, partial [Planctomycetaceae bacterium]|nr:hypothetical protein [Planctomycetaceae bacterium]